MKTIFAILSVVLLSSAGCAVQQYRVAGKNLYILLKHKKAEKVLFLTSLDDYTPHEATKGESGKWEAILPCDREFSYFFLIDGKVFIPDCRMKENDDFGSENCVYIPQLGMP